MFYIYFRERNYNGNKCEMYCHCILADGMMDARNEFVHWMKDMLDEIWIIGIYTQEEYDKMYIKIEPDYTYEAFPELYEISDYINKLDLSL